MHHRKCIEATPVGFEPTRGDPIGLAGRRLNHSAKVSVVACCGTANIPTPCAHRQRSARQQQVFRCRDNPYVSVFFCPVPASPRQCHPIMRETPMPAHLPRCRLPPLLPPASPATAFAVTGNVCTCAHAPACTRTRTLF